MLDLQPGTFEDFLNETKRGNVVPVVRSVLADLQTPVGAFMRVAQDTPYAFLLESVEGGERVARFTFLGASPEMVVRGRGEETIIERGAERETRRVRATDFLREHFHGRKLARRAGLAPLAGGAVGYLAYDAARWFEPKLKVGESDLQHDDAVWMFYRTVLAFDRVRQQIEITSTVLTDEAGGSRARLQELYENAVSETARIEALLESPLPKLAQDSNDAQRTKPSETRRAAAAKLAKVGEAGKASVASEANEGGDASAFGSNWTRAGFEDAVRVVKERIAAGDCYQVVLSQRFTKRVEAEPVSIYRALRATNPSPYMYFFRLGDETVIGASPEMLVRCRGQRLDYRPIAGTRKRGATEAEDWMAYDAR